MLEGFNQLLELMSFDKLGATGVDGLVQRGCIQPLALLQAQDVELGRVLGVGQQAAVVGAGLHQQREAGELRSAVVDVEAVEVLFQDQARDVAQAMLKEALAPSQEGVNIIPSAKLREIAQGEA